ncbi:hypothetical protein JCM11251_002592 [Rhodosporidiobolus azoricus]
MADWPPGSWSWQAFPQPDRPPSPRYLPPPYPPPSFQPPRQHSTYTFPVPVQQPYYPPQQPSPASSSSPPLFPPSTAGPSPHQYIPPLPPPSFVLPLPYVESDVAAAIESARWLQSAFPPPASTQTHSPTSRSQPSAPRASAAHQYPHHPNEPASTGPASTSHATAGPSNSSIPNGLTACPLEKSDEEPTDVKPFIHKLFAMLSDPSAYSDVITWSSDGTAFFVAHNDRFLQEVLPQQFQHNNITSFTRQLNVYDFSRMNIAQLRSALQNPSVSASDYSGWSHRLFRRGDPSNLHLLTPRQSRARLMRKLEKQYGKRKTGEV